MTQTLEAKLFVHDHILFLSLSTVIDSFAGDELVHITGNLLEMLLFCIIP